jgi:hypothetical protein
VALVKGEHVSFGVEQPIRKVVTLKPRVPDPTDRWNYDEVVTHDFSGKLALIIHSGTWERHEERTTWSDAKVQRIESLIPDSVSGLMRIAVALRRREEDRKRRDAEQQKRAQERAQIQKDIEEKEKKLEQFNIWIDLWKSAERMRRFIAAYGEKTRSRSAEKQLRHDA